MDLNKYIYVFLLSLVPSFEGRYAVIVGITEGCSIVEALLPSILGIVFLSVTLPIALPMVDSLMIKLERTRLRKVANTYLKYVSKVRKKAKPYLGWGLIGLIAFVALPLPGTGIWTGSLAAYIFGIRKKKAILALLIGGVFSVLITLTMSLGIKLWAVM